jgi:hypothetical protein
VRFEAEGWRFAADLGQTHGRWSVLMQAREGFNFAAIYGFNGFNGF